MSASGGRLIRRKAPEAGTSDTPHWTVHRDRWGMAGMMREAPDKPAPVKVRRVKPRPALRKMTRKEQADALYEWASLENLMDKMEETRGDRERGSKWMPPTR